EGLWSLVSLQGPPRLCRSVPLSPAETVERSRVEHILTDSGCQENSFSLSIFDSACTVIESAAGASKEVDSKPSVPAGDLTPSHPVTETEKAERPLSIVLLTLLWQHRKWRDP
ncbi:RIPOR family member 3, partial [Dissostichus eleginoides]